MRKWTNQSGASIDAEMVAVDTVARTITIKRADGQSFTIPIASLSEADRACEDMIVGALHVAPLSSEKRTTSVASSQPANDCVQK